MSAMVLIAMPFVAAIALSLLQPGYLDAFLNTEQGNRLLLMAVGSLSVGVLIMRTMIQKALAP